MVIAELGPHAGLAEHGPDTKADPDEIDVDALAA